LNFIRYFQRSTNSKNFIPEIDGLRFFSIVTVLIFHLNTAYAREIGIGLEGWSKLVGIHGPSQFGWWVTRLDLGVKVFFAISGFILGMPFLRHFLLDAKLLDLKEYFYRRLTRLEPPFILTLLGFYFVHVLILNESAFSLLPNFLAGLVYSHVFVFGVPNPINPVTWSLETEAQFYIMLPLVFLLVARLPRKVGFLMVIVAFSLASAYFRSHALISGMSHLSNSIFAYFINFSIGLIFCYLYIKYPAYFSKKKSYRYDLLTLVSLFGLFYFYKPQFLLFNNLLFNTSLFFFFLGTFKGKVSNWFFTIPIVYLIGGMCYTIYLIHYAFFHLIVKFTSQFDLSLNYWANFNFQLLLSFPVLLLISATFYLLVEKPCMDRNWPKRLKNYLIKKSLGLNSE
jgi:peptidoglycan/LPS O-acetylase OafA/YrhL